MGPMNHVRWGSSGAAGRCHGNQLLGFKRIPQLAWVAGVVQTRRGLSGMPGHVGQNDIDFTLLQEELNAPISRPLRPHFAIGPHFDQLWGLQPLNGRG